MHVPDVALRLAVDLARELIAKALVVGLLPVVVARLGAELVEGGRALVDHLAVDAGPVAVLVDELEIGIQLFTHILGDYDAGLEQIHHQVAAVRAGGYRMLRDDDSRTITLTEAQQQACDHARQVRSKVTSSAAGCEECLRIGDTWVHLRICMSCGAVRCCDSSKNRHATRHNAESGHPVIRSYQPGEAWAWCYPDRLSF